MYVEGSDPETGGQWAADRELWAGESITYGCIDGTVGIDGGDSTTVLFPCRTVTVAANGTYAVPNVTKGENWPACRRRTTTIKPRELDNFVSPTNFS